MSFGQTAQFFSKNRSSNSDEHYNFTLIEVCHSEMGGSVGFCCLKALFWAFTSAAAETVANKFSF